MSQHSLDAAGVSSAVGASEPRTAWSASAAATAPFPLGRHRKVN